MDPDMFKTSANHFLLKRILTLSTGVAAAILFTNYTPPPLPPPLSATQWPYFLKKSQIRTAPSQISLNLTGTAPDFATGSS